MTLSSPNQETCPRDRLSRDGGGENGRRGRGVSTISSTNPLCRVSFSASSTPVDLYLSRS